MSGTILNNVGIIGIGYYSGVLDNMGFSKSNNALCAEAILFNVYGTNYVAPYNMEYAKLIIVDDDPDDIELMSDAFKDLNYTNFKTLRSAAELFEYIKDLPTQAFPEIIILDYHLADENGCSLALTLNEDPLLKEVEKILISTTDQSAEIGQFVGQGVLDFIAKPTLYSEYESFVKDIISRMKQATTAGIG